jgi:hypothetical protein
MNIVIGYDPREHEAYTVCEASILRHASRPVNIIRLDAAELRDHGLYDRPYRVDETGQMWDERDKRPFSVAFSFTRFLVPFITRGPALFIDCDFVFRQDVAELFAAFDPMCAVQVVKHNHQPTATMKMDGISQGQYARKNWSSCVLWNVGHHGHHSLTSHAVNAWPGRDLHAFKWLPDCYIGSLPEKWNWLADASPTCGGDPNDIGAIHYTSGGPWFAHMQDCPYASAWLDERRLLRRALAEAA